MPSIGPLVMLLEGAALVPAFRRAGYAARSFDRPERLLDAARRSETRACVLHAGGPAGPAIAPVVRALRRDLPITDVIVWAPRGPARLVREVLLAGARDVVLDAEPEAVVARVASIVEQQQYLPRLLRFEDRSSGSWRFEGLVSRSRRMWDVFDTCVRIAPTDATVLILGETGTGKELLARAIHRRSGRTGPFAAVNCGAVPETLIDSELFGHVRGAFTGALREKPGLFRHAQGGTLLLDEVASLPPAAQNRLLRTLQECTVRPVGGHREIPIDARIIAATGTSLDEAVAAGAFRADLLYRLDVIRFVLPPLRERPEDIVFLFGHFLRKAATHHRLHRPEVTDDFLDALQAFEWRGNVRQLENLAERLLLTHPQGRLTARHFRRLAAPLDAPPLLPAPTASAPLPAAAPPDLGRTLPESIAAATALHERAYLEAMLRECRGRIGDTARRAGIHRRTLLRRMIALGLDKRAFRPLPNATIEPSSG